MLCNNLCSLSCECVFLCVVETRPYKFYVASWLGIRKGTTERRGLVNCTV